jgi:acyl carrier protein
MDSERDHEQERERVTTRLRELVCESLVVTPDRVTDDASLLEQLGADSLDLVNLAMQVETEFSIVIPEKDFEKLVRFNKAVEYIVARMSETELEGAPPPVAKETELPAE